MLLQPNTKLNDLLEHYPECIEFLWPFRSFISQDTQIMELSEQLLIPQNAILRGLKQIIKKVDLHPCHYPEMKRKIIKRNKVNIAGFTQFTWQDEFIRILKSYARSQHIPVNIQLFPKYKKEEFQNYLSVCSNPEDLPDLLIGKGYGSFTTQRFIDLFIRPGYYQRRIRVPIHSSIKNSGLHDSQQHYHTFGVEEFIMTQQRQLPNSLKIPQHWNDLLLPEYEGMIARSGSRKNDHFSFVLNYFIYCKFGEQGIRNFARNIRFEYPEKKLIEDPVNFQEEEPYIQLHHHFANLCEEKNWRPNLIQPDDGNPVIPHYFLLKKNANKTAAQLARFFYSQPITNLLERSGTIHAGVKSKLANEKTFLWPGWDKIKNAPLPFLKEYLYDLSTIKPFTEEIVKTQESMISKVK